MQLPERLRFVTRFRLRVFIRNLSHFATLFFGIMFGSLLLLFGLAMMPLMEHFAQESAKGVPAEHLYVLKTPIEIDVTDDERESYAAAEELMLTDDYAELDPGHLLALYVEASSVDADANVTGMVAGDADDMALEVVTPAKDTDGVADGKAGGGEADGTVGLAEHALEHLHLSVGYDRR